MFTPKNPKAIAYSVMAGVAFLLTIANVYVVKSFDVFGSPLLFALGLVLEIILIIVYVYNVVRALKAPIHIVGSILQSAWCGMLANPYVLRFRKHKNPVIKWATSRLDDTNPYGLRLTMGIALSLLFLAGFGNILINVWFHAPLSRVDMRVLNLMPTIRTPLQTSFFRFVTFSANSETVLLLVVLAGIVLWRKRQRVMAGLFVAVLIAEEGGTYILKHIVGRMRPERYLSLYKEDSYSFPSGHVLRATVIFGLFSYLLYRSFKSSIARLGIILGYICSIALVAISRVYLGVHYPSDVMASIFLGASLLVLIITGLEIFIKYKLWGQNLKSFTNRLLATIPPVIIVAAIAVSPVFIRLSPVVATPRTTTLSTIDEVNVKQLPLYSETLTGKTMEPVSFIYLGSQHQIEQTFLSHGWYIADPSTLANTLKAVAVGFQGDQYLNAPVTPSYLAAKPENMAFQQPTKANTLRQRHHTRLWRTDFIAPDGKQIWVATASFDESIEFAGPAKLPTHHINPDIDAERSYIAKSLGLTSADYLQVVQAQVGKNASGDAFFTDGKALVVSLPN